MKTGSRLVLRQSTGWFAAGWTFAETMTLLSDAAFKLFAWLCLNADRYTGRIRITPAEIALALGKSQSEIQTAKGRTGRTWRLQQRHGHGGGDRRSLLALRKAAVRIRAAGICGSGAQTALCAGVRPLPVHCCR